MDLRDGRLHLLLPGTPSVAVIIQWFGTDHICFSHSSEAAQNTSLHHVTTNIKLWDPVSWCHDPQPYPKVFLFPFGMNPFLSLASHGSPLLHSLIHSFKFLVRPTSYSMSELSLRTHSAMPCPWIARSGSSGIPSIRTTRCERPDGRPRAPEWKRTETRSSRGARQDLERMEPATRHLWMSMDV